MNYRVLFIISFLIIGIGISGLFLISPPEETSTTETTQPIQKEEEKEKVLITTAQLNKSMKKGSLIQLEDYVLNEMSVDIDSPLNQLNLQSVIAQSKENGLQGYVLAQNLEQGAFISPSSLISPQDPKFFLSSVNPSQEVAYKIYISKAESYILDTLLSGTQVSVYSNQDNNVSRTSNNMELVRVVDKSLVLYVEKYADEKDNNGNLIEKEFVGSVSLKLNAEQVKSLYMLPREKSLILVPVDSEKELSPVERKGALIRKLRG